MLKNDRPTTYHNCKPRYYDIDKVPPYYASKAEWKKRGYAVPKRTERMGTVEHWNVRNYIRYDLYHISQCRKISGDKAEKRRSDWLRSLSA